MRILFILRARIDALTRGEALLDPYTTALVLTHVRKQDRKAEEDAFRDLSDRELHVLVHAARGKTNAEIGKILHQSEKAARNYGSSVLQTLRLSNRIELATDAVEHHIFDRREE